MSYAPLLAVAIAGTIMAMYAKSGAERTQEAQEVQVDARVADDLTAAADALSTFLAPRQAIYTSSFGLKTGGIGTIPWSTVSAAIPDAPPATNKLGQDLSVVLLAKVGYDMDGNGLSCESDAAEPCPIDAYIVTTGGTTVNDARLASIANRVTQSRGGGVYDVMAKISSSAPHDYAGGDNWVLNRASFGPIPWPTPGHPIAHVVIGGANTDITAPSRYPHPTRNKWHANQDFAGCDDPSTPAVETTAGCNITNAGDVTLATGQTLSGAVIEPIPAADGDHVSKPSCPSGRTPDAFTVKERDRYDSAGTLTNGTITWLEDFDATTWVVNYKYSTPTGYLPAESADYGRVIVLRYCKAI